MLEEMPARGWFVALALVVGTALADGKPARKPPAAAHRKPALPRWQQLPLPPPMPTATTSGAVEVHGASIYYAIYGKGTPVILLHGGLGNSDHFAFQLPALIDRFQVIVIDSRGQGRSTLSKAKLSYHAMAGDVVAVMDKLAIERAALVGWSDGGEIALDLAIHHPERVARMFIVGANYDAHGSKPRGGSSSPTFRAYAAKCRADHQQLSRKPSSFDAVIDALLPVWRNPAQFTRAQIESIQAPSMIALGDHDEIIVLDQIKEMAKLIPHGQLKVFADASHFVMWQDPTSFNNALVEFLTAPN
jgi:pimeloyl-ACP methyl ester carboxylesterase